MVVLQQLKRGMMFRHVTSYCLCTVILHLCDIIPSVATSGITLNVPVTEVRYSNVTPMEAWKAVDNNTGTSWDTPRSIKLYKDSFTAEFDRPYTVSITPRHNSTVFISPMGP